MEAVAGQPMDAMRRVDFYTSHEALLLPYEEAQTRRVPRRTGWYNLATHLPWIGLRTNDLEGAHIEYGRGIANPSGVKIGPATRPEWLRELIAALNPGNEPGRLMLIHRMGAEKVADALPPLIEEVLRLGKHATWCCDPMHGNTETTAAGVKTRRFENILAELEAAFKVHRALGSYLGGVHFELTGEDVTECTGGARGLADADLTKDYRSQVDPRLNYGQALELAMRIATVARSS
jgi:3-deoxy-7-phosphoheptulonate synthase